MLSVLRGLEYNERAGYRDYDHVKKCITSDTPFHIFTWSE
jgi:hypothetical protein